MLHTRQTSGDDGHTYLGIRNPCIQILEYVLKSGVYLLVKTGTINFFTSS
jgi:hypothetical protein